MPQLQIIDFIAGWDLDDNNGAIKVKFANQADYQTIPQMNDRYEFHIILTLLQGPKPVFYNTDKRSFYTKPA